MTIESSRLRKSLVFGKRDDGHDFRSRGDDETGLAASTFFFTVERNMNVAQRAVVHVDGARPGDAVGMETQFVAVKKMSVNQRCEQIVRRGDGVKIPMKMKIDFRAGLDLREAATRGAALHAKNRAERRFARSDDDFFPDVREALRQADGSDGLPFPRSRGRGRGDDNQFPAALERGIGEQFQPNFAAMRPQKFQIFFGKIEFARYGLNRRKSFLHMSL